MQRVPDDIRRHFTDGKVERETPLIVNGKRVEPGVVVGTGWTAAVVAALALLGLVWRIAA